MVHLWSHLHSRLLRKGSRSFTCVSHLVIVSLFNFYFSLTDTLVTFWGTVCVHFTAYATLVDNLIFLALVMDGWPIRSLLCSNLWFCSDRDLKCRYWYGWKPIRQHSADMSLRHLRLVVGIYNLYHLTCTEIMTALSMKTNLKRKPYAFWWTCDKKK